MFLAGFYGDDAAWKRVAKEWPETLGPQRQHLHMNRLRFERESERQMLERAAQVPRNCGLVPILGGVRRSDYRDLFIANPAWHLMNGYVVCLWSMLFDTLRGLPSGERLEVVFEEQERFSGFAQEAIKVLVQGNPPEELLLPDGRPKLASWRWVPKGSTSLLEPADYLCFALSKFHREYGSVKQKWSYPIMRGQEGEGFGFILQRDDARKAFANAPNDSVEEMDRVDVKGGVNVVHCGGAKVGQ